MLRLANDSSSADKPLPSRLGYSWQRCYEHGLRHGDRAPIDPVESTRIRQLLQRDVQLVTVAQAEVESLSQALADTRHLAFVVDDHGFIVVVAGDAAQPGPLLGKVRTGIELSEAAFGTNAAGTVLIEQRPTKVYRSQHFLAQLEQLECVAVPIMGPRGEVAGGLCISCELGTLLPGVAELAQASVSRMEQALLGALNSPAMLYLHPHHDGLGGAANGLLAVGNDGEVLGVNSAATRMLGLSAAQVCGNVLGDLFDSDPLRAKATWDVVHKLRVRSGLGICARLLRGNDVTLVPRVAEPVAPAAGVAKRDLPPLIEPLSERESQVLEVLVQGASNKEIAEQLQISYETVKYHLKNIFSKLCAGNRLEAAALARRHGLVA